MITTMIGDMRLAARMMLRSPGFAAVAVLTLALGIGANTALFSVVDALLLRPLPFPEPDRLVMVWPGRPADGWEHQPASFPNFTDWRARSTSFAHLAAYYAYASSTFNVTAGGEPERVQGAYVSSDFFPALGVEPLAGRWFLSQEEKPGGSERVAVIAHALWASRFGADPGAVGKAVHLDGVAHTIVGVMPAGFAFPRHPRDPQVWLPLGHDPRQGRTFSRGTNYLSMIGRLAPGVTLDQAGSEMAALTGQLAQEHPRANSGMTMKVAPMSEHAAGDLRGALLTLLGTVGLVLLIACANVAHLTLARAAGRRRELAVRSALGATHGRIVRQLLAESLLLAAAGGAAGLLLGAWGIELIARLPFNDPGYTAPFRVAPSEIGMSGTVLAFTMVLSLATAVLFGLIPSLQTARADAAEALKEGSGRATDSARRRRLRDLLVVAEVSLSLLLLVGAGLMVRSYLRLTAVDPGFRPAGVLTAALTLPAARYPDDASLVAFQNALVERLRALPGVRAAGTVRDLPMSGSDEETGIHVEGVAPPQDGPPHRARPRPVGDGYFQAIGIPLRAGRGFTASDTVSSPRVAVVNETLARRLWPGGDPIGRRVALNYETLRYFPDRPPEPDLASAWREVVGVVGDVRHAGLLGEIHPELYVPIPQSAFRNFSVVVRADTGVPLPAAELRAAVRSLDPEQAVADVRGMEALVGSTVARPRFHFLLLALFAVLALALCAIGIYGVMACVVSQRLREIGIRIALGADRRSVMALVVGQGMRLTLAGLALGAAAALGLTRLLAGLLFGVSATDPSTFAGMAFLMAAVSLLACALPAWRACRIDPAAVLRAD